MRRKITELVCLLTLSVTVLCCNSISDIDTIGSKNRTSEVTFTASLENSLSTKTTISDSWKVLWSENDQICVNGSTMNLTDGVNLPVGVFSGQASVTQNGWYAAYPASYSSPAIPTVSSSGDITVSIPASQTYSATIGGTPMVAHNSSNLSSANLEFKNVCNLLKLNLKVSSGSKTVNSITVRTLDESIKINGSLSIPTTSWNGTEPTLGVYNGTNTTTLDCLVNSGQGVTIGTTATPFYIIIPPIPTGKQIVVTINTSDNKVCELSYTATADWTRSKILNSIEINVIEQYVYIDEYNISRGCGILINGVTWAPVNCGYIAAGEKDQNGKIYSKGYPYGKLYQWGRKYGQGRDGDEKYPSDDPNTSGGSFGTQISDLSAGGISNDNVFYKSNANWLSVTSYSLEESCNKLWESAKGNNDPCPYGWRIPTKAEFDKLLENTVTKSKKIDTQPNFATFSQGENTITLHSGQRKYDGTYNHGITYYFIYWTCEHHENTYNEASCLKYDASTAKFITGYDYRGRGLPVRCVKE